MKIVADENIEAAIVRSLRYSGFEVISILEISPGIPDDEVLNTAVSEDALLLTEDKDFGDLVFRQKRAFCGVILLRLDGLSNDQKAAIVTSALERSCGDFIGTFTVITPRQIRIRHQAQ